MVRAPSQMTPFPTVLQVSNDGGGGVSVCVTGCPAAAGPALASVKVAMPARTIAGPLMSPMMVLIHEIFTFPLFLSRFAELMSWLKLGVPLFGLCRPRPMVCAARPTGPLQRAAPARGQGCAV